MKAYNRKMPINWSNNKIYEYIYNRVISDANIFERIVAISNILPYINIQETLDRAINLLVEKNLILDNTEIIVDFKNMLSRKKYANYTSTKIQAEFYGAYLFHTYQKEYYKNRTGKELIGLDYKIHREQLIHNKETIQEEVIKRENEKRIEEIEKLPILEQLKAFLDLSNEFEKYHFLNKTKVYSDYIKFFKSNIKRLKEELKYSKVKKSNSNYISNSNQQNGTDNLFSVLEWTSIFYYANETKLLPESRFIKTRMKQFMSNHNINTTFVYFKNTYYKAINKINKINDYPIEKLELILPFVKENYSQAVTKIENDIIFLNENQPDN